MQAPPPSSPPSSRPAKRTMLVVFGRMASRRVPRKMLVPLGSDGQTLASLVLKKLKASTCIPWEDVFVMWKEPELRAVATRFGVKVVERSDEATQAMTNKIEVVYDWCHHAPPEYTHFIVLNGCLPLMPIGTVDRFYRDFQASDADGMFSVCRRNAYIYSERDCTTLVNPFVGNMVDTAEMRPVYEQVHALHAGRLTDVRRGVLMGDYAAKGQPELWAGISESEMLDIDDPWQLEMARAVIRFREGV